MKTPIILDNEFSLDSDGKQWILRYSAEKQVTDKDNKTKTVTSSDEWYYGSTSTMLANYVEKSLKKSGSATVDELIRKVDELMNRIADLYETGSIPDKSVFRKQKFAVDPPEAADEEEDEQLADEFEEFVPGVQDVLGDMF